MDFLTSIRQPIGAELRRYETLFADVMKHDEEFMDQILAFVAQRKGKMMRPVLVLLLARSLGEVGDSTLRAAVALELLHTSSLIHDDVVDESLQRRGADSLHRIFDNKVAVLLGDYLLSQTLAQSALTGSVSVVSAVARLGTMLAEGEILQLRHVEMDDISEEIYFSIIRRKTASLFEACADVAAYTMGASAAQHEWQRGFCEKIGLCFQIRDDIFDYFDDASIGKPRGKDLEEGKLTLPLIHALHASADAEMFELARRAKRGESSVEDRQRLTQFAIDHGGIAYAERTMSRLRNEALLLLESCSQQDLRQSLVQYLDFVIGRSN